MWFCQWKQALAPEWVDILWLRRVSFKKKKETFLNKRKYIRRGEM
jgi:hypothetical protein